MLGCVVSCRWACRPKHAPPPAKAKGPKAAVAQLQPNFKSRVLPDTILCSERPQHVLSVFPEHTWMLNVTAINGSTILAREAVLQAKMGMNQPRPLAARGASTILPVRARAASAASLCLWPQHADSPSPALVCVSLREGGVCQHAHAHAECV